jgi:membrane protease subunit HflK
VQLQDVDPPEAVAAAFKDVTNAKEDREKLINQAQGYRNDIIPRAKGEAAELVNRARGFAQARVNRAQGETNRFLATLKEYNQAKDVISKRIYIETLEEVLPHMEKIIIDGKGGERLLPYLPLDRLSKPASVAKPVPQLESEEPRPDSSPTLKSRNARP